VDDPNPTARALRCLELLQDHPGITADRLAGRLGVSDRAARRYVAVLREAGLPIESERGRYGGYRVGRGLRLRPLMFTTTEALGLVMAVLEGGHAATDADDPVQTALGKIIRGLPEPVARPAEALRAVAARRREPDESTPHPETTALIVEACGSGHRVRLHYRLRPDRDSVMVVDPWTVMVRYGRWYLLCWSHSREARRLLRVDRVSSVDVLDETFVPPADLDPSLTIDEHLAHGWTHRVEVVIEAPVDEVARWLPRHLGRVEELDPGRTRLTGSTDDLEWYAGQLTAIRTRFRIVDPPELREAADRIGRNLRAAAGSQGD
jgi:predicted DNA-binding transcriptional regulator YafY